MPTFKNIQQEIAAMLDIPDEELTDEQKTAMDVYLDELANQETAKVDGFAQFIKMEASKAEACKKEGHRLVKKGTTAERRIDYLKFRYLQIMREHGLKKINGDIYSLSVRSTTAVSVPSDFVALKKLEEFNPLYVSRKVELVPDKRVIRESLKDGLEVPGCSLVESQSLQIR